MVDVKVSSSVGRTNVTWWLKGELVGEGEHVPTLEPIEFDNYWMIETLYKKICFLQLVLILVLG